MVRREVKERWTEVEACVKDKQEQQFAAWLSGKGISFENPDAERAYKMRTGLIKDAIQLVKPPQRVPVCPASGFFPARYAGSTLYDAMYAKQTVGKVACIAGNVPLGLLCTGTEDQVKVYCKALIDTAGRDGGFILSTGAGMDDAKPDNVRAMIQFSKAYGALS